MDATLPLQGLDDVQKRPRNGVSGVTFSKNEVKFPSL